ncbi:dUTP diphosphatase [Haematospirillum jordaniae]|uniref:dUTP diphosphatase n=1 Tax=Haematospirillum jordaniae TaxID=1549855 RepID=UPI001432FCAB|nr:dUTP diphosphatase [Haematospirillum jordaniae]NKD86390.1 dUTP diphosphatase [Haematospirillum jordaniae]
MTTSAPTIRVSVVRLPHGSDLPLPACATELSAGMDMFAALESAVTLDPGKRALVPTGLAFALPAGFEAQVRPRSGLAAKHGVTVLNTPGTIDADYRGEVKVILVNLGDEPFVIEHGMRIAQVIFAPVTRAVWAEVETLPATDRGEGGFGSTGTRAQEDRAVLSC